MRHKKYIELINLSITGELSEKEINELNAHISECPECNKLFAETLKLNNIRFKDLFIEPEKRILLGSRAELFSKINGSKTDSGKKYVRISAIPGISPKPGLQSIFGQLSTYSFFTGLLLNNKRALTFISIFIFGLFSGFFLFKFMIKDNISKEILIDNMIIAGEPRLQNLKFIQSGSENGSVEFTIDAVIKTKVTGNINEPQIQNILARALVNEQNPGVRLKTVSAFSEKGITGGMKSAIMQTLKNDDNPGVRAEALNVLRNMSFDKEIEETLIYVLQNENNSGIRISALKMIEKYQAYEGIKESRLYSVLKVKSETDENSFIRYKAAALAEEIKQ